MNLLELLTHEEVERELNERSERDYGIFPYEIGLQALRTALHYQARQAIAIEALRSVVDEFNLWSEDASDGTYAYYRSDGLMVACVKARATLALLGNNEEEKRNG